MQGFNLFSVAVRVVMSANQVAVMFKLTPLATFTQDSALGIYPQSQLNYSHRKKSQRQVLVERMFVPPFFMERRKSVRFVDDGQARPELSAQGEQQTSPATESETMARVTSQLDRAIKYRLLLQQVECSQLVQKLDSNHIIHQVLAIDISKILMSRVFSFFTQLSQTLPALAIYSNSFLFNQQLMYLITMLTYWKQASLVNDQLELYKFAEFTQNHMQLSQYIITLLLTVFISQNQVQAQSQSQNNCPFGHYRTHDSKCAQCLTSCSNCKDLASPCQGCAEAEIYSQHDKTCHSCKRGQLSCGSTVTCQPHYQLVKNECQPICQAQNCLSCQSIFTRQCKLCSKNYIISGDRKSCKIKEGRSLQTEKEQLNLPILPNMSNINSQLNGVVKVLEQSNSTTTRIEIPNSIQKNIDTLIKGKLADTLTAASNTSINSGLSFPPLDPSVFPQGDFNAGGFQPLNTIPQIASKTTPAANSTGQDTPIPQNQSQITSNLTSQQHNSSKVSVNVGVPANQTITKNENITKLSNNTNDQPTVMASNASQTNLTSPAGIGSMNSSGTTPTNNSTSNNINDSNTTLNIGNSTNNSKSINKTTVTPSTDNCHPGTYFDGSACINCDTKCASCINSPQQCLQCAEGWRKHGWKCIKNETMSFNFTLQIPAVLTQSLPRPNVPTPPNTTNISSYVEQLKAYLLSSILPKEYATQPNSITFNSLQVQGRKLILAGTLDRLTIKIADLKKYINDKLKNVNNLGPLILNSYQLSNTPTQNPAPSPEPTRDLTGIIVGSVIGGLLLISLVACLICYCYKSCCFKKDQQYPKATQHELQPVSSDRRLRKSQIGDKKAKIPQGEWGYGASNEVLGERKYEITSDEQEAGKVVVRKTYDSNNLGDEVIDYANDKGDYQYPNTRY